MLLSAATDAGAVGLWGFRRGSSGSDKPKGTLSPQFSLGSSLSSYSFFRLFPHQPSAQLMPERKVSQEPRAFGIDIRTRPRVALYQTRASTLKVRSMGESETVVRPQRLTSAGKSKSCMHAGGCRHPRSFNFAQCKWSRRGSGFTVDERLGTKLGLRSLGIWSAGRLSALMRMASVDGVLGLDGDIRFCIFTIHIFTACANFRPVRPGRRR